MSIQATEQDTREHDDITRAGDKATAKKPSFFKTMIARSNGIGVSRKPPHPNAALLFYEYNLSDAQPLILKLNYLSPVKKLESPLRGARILFVDPATDSAEVERCDNAYDALIKTKK